MKRDRREFLKGVGTVSILAAGGTQSVNAEELNHTRSYAVAPADTDGYLAIEEVASNLVTSNDGDDPGFRNRFCVLRNNQSTDESVTAEISIDSWGSANDSGYIEINGNDVGQSASVTLNKPGDAQSVYLFVPNDTALGGNNLDFTVTASAPNKNTRARSLQSTLTYVEIIRSDQKTTTEVTHDDIKSHTNVDQGHSDAAGGTFSDYTDNGHADTDHNDNHTNDSHHDSGHADTDYSYFNQHTDEPHQDTHQDDHTNEWDFTDNAHSDFDNHSDFKDHSDFGNFGNFGNFGKGAKKNPPELDNESPAVYQTAPTTDERGRALQQSDPDHTDAEIGASESGNEEDDSREYGFNHSDFDDHTDNGHDDFKNVKGSDYFNFTDFSDFSDHHSNDSHTDTGFSDYSFSDFHTDHNDTSYYFTDSFQDVAEVSHTNVETTTGDTTYYETTVENPGYPSGTHSDSFSDFIDHPKPFVDTHNDFSDFAQARFSDNIPSEQAQFTDFADFQQS